jgi:transposase-like protein
MGSEQTASVTTLVVLLATPPKNTTESAEITTIVKKNTTADLFNDILANISVDVHRSAGQK